MLSKIESDFRADAVEPRRWRGPYGWGVHSDSAGRVALLAMDSGPYAALAADPRVAKVAGMRSAR